MTLEEFVLSNDGLVKKIAGHYYGICSDYGIEFEDLYQVGCLALIEKYKNYNSTKGNVSTYATYVIKSAILNYINSNNSITYIPKNMMAFSLYVQNKNLEFYQNNGRYMTDEEILSFIKNSDYVAYKKNIELVETLQELINYHLKTESVSLNTLVNIDGEQKELVNCIIANYNLEESIISKMNCDEILDIIRDRISFYGVVCGILGLDGEIPQTRYQLAEKYGTCQQNIDKKYKKALKKIRKNI